MEEIRAKLRQLKQEAKEHNSTSKMNYILYGSGMTRVIDELETILNKESNE